MRADTAFLQRTFDRANREIFGGRLPEVALKTGSAGRSFGTFRAPRIAPKGDFSRCSITVSSRFDVPEAELADTVIHEMIHLYIYAFGIDDDGPHGSRFRAIMNRINREHGRHITVTGRCSDEMRASDSRKRWHCFCISRLRGGQRCITVCASTRILDMHRMMKGWTEIVGLEWFGSTDPWFSRFPKSRTPKLYRISDDDMEKHVAQATRLECDGTKITIKK